MKMKKINIDLKTVGTVLAGTVFLLNGLSQLVGSKVADADRNAMKAELKAEMLDELKNGIFDKQ